MRYRIEALILALIIALTAILYLAKITGAWTPRASVVPIPAFVAVPERDSLALPEEPDQHRPTPGAPQPSPSASEGSRPATRGAPTLYGVASYYAWRPFQAAAGPALRRALGPDWRGRRVEVCRGTLCVVVALTDWCQCYGTRVIDLDSRVFALLAPLSRGLIDVKIVLKIA